MGFPLHPQLLQSYPVPTAEPHPHAAKRKSTHPMHAPTDEKIYRPSDTLHSVRHVAYLPIVTSPPTDESRDRKHSMMTSSLRRGSSDEDLDQDGALDLTKK